MMKKLCKQLHLTIATLLMMAGTCLIATHPAQASASNYELIAEIERITGINERFSTGLSFASADECKAEIMRMNLVYNNLQLSGVMPSHHFQFSCSAVQLALEVSSN